MSGVVAEIAGWRWALAPYGLAAVTAGAAWVILPRDQPASTMSIGDQVRGMGDAIRNRLILVTYVGGGLAFAAVFGVYLTVLATHLEREFGLSASWRGLLIGFPASCRRSAPSTSGGSGNGWVLGGRW